MAAGDVSPNWKACSSLQKEAKASQEVKNEELLSSHRKARALTSTSCFVNEHLIQLWQQTLCFVFQIPAMGKHTGQES